MKRKRDWQTRHAAVCNFGGLGILGDKMKTLRKTNRKDFRHRFHLLVGQHALFNLHNNKVSEFDIERFTDDFKCAEMHSINFI